MKILRFSLFFCCFFLFLFSNQLDINVFAKTAILMNAENGRVLFEKDAQKKAFPASLSKIATALFALESEQQLQRSFHVSEKALRVVSSEKKHQNYDQYPSYFLESDGSSCDLKKGEEISFQSLLYGLMLVSGNDCANVIAENIGNSIPHFVQDLNDYLKTLGCKDTHFCNPHGLHHPDHVTTAYDMAVIAKRALEIPLFKKIVSTTSYLIPETNKQEAREIELYNGLLDKTGKYYYPYAIGIKTGYHKKANYNLVAAATYQGRTLIAVLMGGERKEDRYIDAKKLFSRAFLEKRRVEEVFFKDQVFEVPVEGGKDSLKAYLKKSVTLEYYPAEEVEVKAFVQWGDLTLPIKKDAKVGDLSILTEKGEVVESCSLYAKERIEKNFFYKIREFFKHFF